MTKTLTLRVPALALALACGAALATPAQAGEAGFMPWTDILMMADTNKDGMVTMPEVMTYEDKRYEGFMPWMGKNFNSVDLNEDGMVTMYEMKKYLMDHDMDERDLTLIWYSK
jgi:hypothetical protein